MRWRFALGWVAWGLTLALAAACLVFTRLNHLTPERYFAEFIVSSVAGSVTFSTVGALITARRPDNRIGWLLSAAGLTAAISANIQQYVRYALVTRPGSLPGGDLLAWLNLWVWVPQTALFLIYLPLLYPDGRLPSPRWRWAAWYAAAAAVVLSFNIAITPGPIDYSLHEVSNPYAPAWSAQVLPWLNPLVALLVLPSIAAGMASPLVRLRRAQGVERMQMRIFAFASALLGISFLLPFFLYYPNFTRETVLSGILLGISIPMMPVVVGVAVLRYRLYDIDVLIRGTLIYSVLSFLLVIGYLVGVVLLQGLIIALTGETSSLAIAGSTLLMALLFQPMRSRIQRVIDRVFYRQKYDPSHVLSRFSGAMRSEVDLDRLAGMLVEQVEETMQPQSVSLWLVRRGEEEATGPFHPGNI